ncbi:MAG TPA: penicillin acylase family protein [Burkholderiaceae bacterium]|nr:penicillin acylase family protein [Burkholderiaceae bacterium]
MRILRWIGWASLALLVTAVAAGLWYRQASQPLHEGSLQVAGLAAPVKVRRDAQGIPTIVAASERDAIFALGFVHAQDRLWQIEFNRRLAAGRLAEILGPAALPTDRFLRTLGVHRTAQRIYDSMDDGDRALIDAYVEGVNACLAARSGPLPPEFLLTGAPAPGRWTAADSIAWSLMMAWDLASHSMRMELRRLRLAQRFTRAEIDDFYPRVASEDLPATADYVEMYRLLGAWKTAGESSNRVQLSAIPTAGFGEGEGLGSNNWVLSGRRTVSGKPLLANDPHLGLTAPSVWYFAALEAPGLNVLGATLPGVPGVVLGRNASVAWGMTNTGVDQQDLYLERLNPDDNGEYETPTGWQQFAERTERIAVKGQGEQVLTVRETRHGPVLSGLESIDKSFAHPRYVLALRWSALEPDDRTLIALRGLNRAGSLAEAERALGDFQIVTQSVVLADTEGHIGLVVTGRIPRRSAGNDLRGIAPALGWDARYDWEGYLTYADAPRDVDPESGFIATANNKIVGAEYPHHLTFDWFASYRVQRIRHLVDAREKHDMASTRSIQADVVSTPARELMAVMGAAQPLTTAGREALVRLKAWDGTMAPDRPEPLLFHAWRRELARRVFEDDFGDLAADFVTGADTTRALLNVLTAKSLARDWCDDRRTEQRFESCLTLMSESLDASVQQLAESSGRDLAGLRWGESHQAIAEHRPLSSAWLLASFFGLRTPFPGDTFTINVGALSNRPDAPFSTSHAASLRAIYDLSAADSSTWVLSTGQAGHPLSDSYASMLPLWRDVQSLPMRFAATSNRELVLQPKR